MNGRLARWLPRRRRGAEGKRRRAALLRHRTQQRSAQGNGRVGPPPARPGPRQHWIALSRFSIISSRVCLDHRFFPVAESATHTCCRGRSSAKVESKVKALSEAGRGPAGRSEPRQQWQVRLRRSERRGGALAPARVQRGRGRRRTPGRPRRGRTQARAAGASGRVRASGRRPGQHR